MNFQPLFTTTRIVVSFYRLISTAILLGYIFRKKKDGREYPRDRSFQARLYRPKDDDN